jgi:hypothetical protein
VSRRLGLDFAQQHLLQFPGHHPLSPCHRRTVYQEFEQFGRVASSVVSRFSRLPDRQSHPQLKGKRGSVVTLRSTGACPGSSLAVPLGLLLVPPLTIVHAHLGILAAGQ